MDFDLFENIPSGADAWTKRYFEQKEKYPDAVTRWEKNSNQAMVEVVYQKRPPAQQEVKQFYDAQRDLAKNGLPDQSKQGAYNISGATTQLCEMQLKNMSEFSDQSFKTGTVLGGDYNPKEPFINTKKKDDEMEVDPNTAFQKIYPMPFGNTNPQSAATKPLESGVGANPAKDTFKDMQKLNTVDYVGDRYLPKSTQDGKSDNYLPPEFQLSSATVASLGCLMAMVPSETSSHFVNFATQNIEPHSLHAKGIENEPHVTVLFGFNGNFDSSKLENLLKSSGPIAFTVGSINRFQCPEYDVMHFQVHSPELEMMNAKIAREFANQIDNSNYKYNPHLTIAYVQPGTNTHLDGKSIRKQTFGVAKLLYSPPNQKGRRFISLSWDAQKFDDGGMQPGLGEKETNSKPLNNLGDKLQEFLVKRSETKKADKQSIDDQLKKTLEEKQKNKPILSK